jgi:hypothetical protein
VFATISASNETKYLMDIPKLEKVQWAGFMALNYIWFAMTKVNYLAFVLLQAM